VATNLGTKKKKLFFLVSLQQNSVKKHQAKFHWDYKKFTRKKIFAVVWQSRHFYSAGVCCISCHAWLCSLGGIKEEAGWYLTLRQQQQESGRGAMAGRRA